MSASAGSDGTAAVGGQQAFVCGPCSLDVHADCHRLAGEFCECLATDQCGVALRVFVAGPTPPSVSPPPHPWPEVSKGGQQQSVWRCAEHEQGVPTLDRPPRRHEVCAGWETDLAKLECRWERVFSDEIERITSVIGDSPLHWPASLYPPPSPHWEHIYDAGCAICKAPHAPEALRIVIEAVLAADSDQGESS